MPNTTIKGTDILDGSITANDLADNLLQDRHLPVAGTTLTFPGSIFVNQNLSTSGYIQLSGSTSQIRSNNPISFLKTDGTAETIYIESLLVSSSYSDSTKIPTNGIWSRGDIYTSGNVHASGAISVSGDIYSSSGVITAGSHVIVGNYLSTNQTTLRVAAGPAATQGRMEVWSSFSVSSSHSFGSYPDPGAGGVYVDGSLKFGYGHAIGPYLTTSAADTIYVGGKLSVSGSVSASNFIGTLPTGDTGYIWNQYASSQVASFNVTGSGYVGTMGVAATSLGKAFEVVGDILSKVSDTSTIATSLKSDSSGGSIWINSNYSTAAPTAGWSRVITVTTGSNTGFGVVTPTHKIELASATTAAGGLSFGTDIELYRNSTSGFVVNAANGTIFTGSITASGSSSQITIGATSVAPLVVSSTTKVSNLNSDLLDGYNTEVVTAYANSTVIPTMFKSSYTALTSGSWYRIAINGNPDSHSGGNRASAIFSVYDLNSGLHSATKFIATTHYGSNPSLTLLSRGYYSNYGVISKIRLLTATTYDGAIIEVYCRNSGSIYFTIESNGTQAGWSGQIPATGAVPSGFNTSTCPQIDLDTNNPVLGISTISNQNGIMLTNTGQLVFGADTNLYRSATNLLATDDNFDVSGTSRVRSHIMQDAGEIWHNAYYNSNYLYRSNGYAYRIVMGSDGSLNSQVTASGAADATIAWNAGYGYSLGNTGIFALGLYSSGASHRLELAAGTVASSGIALGTDVEIYRSATSGLTINAGSGTTFTGTLNLAANSTSRSPITFSSGSLLSSPLNGAMEYNGTAVYFTVGSTRNQFAFTSGTVSYADSLVSNDNRTIIPNEYSARSIHYGFGTWNNNNAAPYADFLNMDGWTDSSGGKSNLLLIAKNFPGIRLYQRAWDDSSHQSSGAYSAYNDIVISENGTTQNYIAKFNTVTSGVTITNSNISDTGSAITLGVDTTVAGNLLVSATGKTLGSTGTYWSSGFITNLSGSTGFLSGSNATPLVLARDSTSNVNIEYRNATASMWAGINNGNNFAIGNTQNLGTPQFVFTSGGYLGVGVTSPYCTIDTSGSINIPYATHGNYNGIVFKNQTYTFIHDFNYGNNGTVTTAGFNIFFGITAGNLTFGSGATNTVHGSYNHGFGALVLSNLNNGYANIGIGYKSLFQITDGYHNIAIGHNALLSGTTATDNVAIGSTALYGNVSGTLNVAIGYGALSNSISSYNVGIGYSSLVNVSQTGCVSIGSYSSTNMTSGGLNTSIGHSSLLNITSGQGITAVGANAGRSTSAAGTNVNSTASTYLGYNTQAYADGDSNETVIGYNAVGSGSNTVSIGNSSVTGTYLHGAVGINLTGAASHLIELPAGTAASSGISFGGDALIYRNGTSGLNITSPSGLTLFGPLLYSQLGNTSGFITSNGNPAIYASSNVGGSYPFDGGTNGNLVIQGRSSFAKDIVFATGTTPSVQMIVYGSGGVLIPSGLTLQSDPANASGAVRRSYLEGYVQGRGMNLFENGMGLMGSNYNMSGFTYDQVNNYAGKGSFKATGSNLVKTSDNLIPVDGSRYYRLSQWMESSTLDSGNAGTYSGIACYDIDGNAVSPQFFMRISGTDTTLAADLNPGDTVVHLTNGSNWLGNSSLTYQRQMLIWDYTNGQGYTYPAYTYSRHYSGNYATYGSSGMWASGGISGNDITLTAPWPASLGTVPAGTAVSNTSAGSTYKYINPINTQLPSTWTNYAGVIGGWDTAGANSSGVFPYGTAFVRLLWLLNRPSGGTSTNVTNISDVWFSELSSWNLEPASASQPGVVALANQTMGSGDKYFTGKVTIGTTTPEGQLTISGSPVCFFPNNTGNYNEGLRLHPASNGYSVISMNAVAGSGGTGAGQWNILAGSSSTQYDFTLRYNSTDIYTLTSGGMLGLGYSIGTQAVHRLELSAGTVAASGIGFGTDTEVYRNGTSGLSINAANGITTTGNVNLSTTGYVYQIASKTVLSAPDTSGKVLTSNSDGSASWVTSTHISEYLIFQGNKNVTAGFNPLLESGFLWDPSLWCSGGSLNSNIIKVEFMSYGGGATYTNGLQVILRKEDATEISRTYHSNGTPDYQVIDITSLIPKTGSAQRLYIDPYVASGVSGEYIYQAKIRITYEN